MRYLPRTLNGGAKVAEAIERLALEVFSSLGIEIFLLGFGKAVSKYDFADIVRK